MDDSNSLLEQYRALIQLRNNYSTIQTGNLIPLKSNKPAVYSALRMDENGTFLIMANLSDEAISEYNIVLLNAGLAESAYSVDTVFGADQAKGLERSGEIFPEYKPLESLNPHAMYVLKLTPK
jgi:glycosidase